MEESVRLLLKKQHPVKRQPHSATTLKKWRGEESPSVYGGEDVNKSLAMGKKKDENRSRPDVPNP